VVVESRELHILPAIPPRHLADGADGCYPWPRYSLSRELEGGHARGKIVITV
jgi:hypothetical protein